MSSDLENKLIVEAAAAFFQLIPSADWERMNHSANSELVNAPHHSRCWAGNVIDIQKIVDGWMDK